MEVTTACEEAQLLYAGCAHLSVDQRFLNSYGSFTAPRPLLWNKPGNFSFENMGPLTRKFKIFWLTPQCEFKATVI